MTGTELFEALSFVDEKYIQEAENAKLRTGTPWMKILSVAACLCILLTGMYAYKLLQPKGAMESMKEFEAAAPARPESAVEEAAPMEAPRQESAVAEATPEPPLPVEEEAAAGELEHVPFAHLRILQVREDGSYEVFVERVAEEPGPFGAGVTMTLVIDPEKIPVEDRTDLPYAAPADVNMLVEVRNGAYDAGTNTLYAEGVFAAARE